MNTSVHFSSATDLWATPQDFFDKLNAEFGFTLDVCATPENAKCPRYFTRQDDGIKQSWRNEVVWMNPPYGRGIRLWVEKARIETRIHNPRVVVSRTDGPVKFAPHDPKTTVVALLPARTDTVWFQEWVLPYAELRWVRGRLKFGGHENSAPFPSVVAVYRGSK